jgi:hypothetical protein
MPEETAELENQSQWCFAWMEEAKVEGATRAALLKANKWGKDTNIRIAFMGGDDAQKQKVKTFAQGWLDTGIRLKFNWIEDPNQAEIRISFVEGAGSWSSLGTTCKNVPKTKATMNYGWLKTAKDAEAKRVILHEFGHALGLIHEHQNPIGGIDWNKDAVYKDLGGPPNNWDKAKVDFNMFHSFPASAVEGTAVDSASIMMYPIPKTWTKDGFSARLNPGLSPQDVSFIKKAYS